MANKKISKVPFNEKRFREAIDFKNISIQTLCNPINGFGRSSKQIYRYIKEKEIPPNVLDELGKFLDVEPDYLSGKYDEIFNKITDSEMRNILNNQLNVKDYPYIKKYNHNKFNGKYLEEDYIEKLLIVHGISPKRLELFNKKTQLEFQLEIEKNIVPTLMKYFGLDATKKDFFESISRLSIEIEKAIDEINFEI